MEDQTLKEELNSELTGLNKGEKAKRKKQIIIASALSLLFIIIIIVIIILINTGSNLDEDTSNLELLGEINCIYDVQSISSNTLLIGNDFIKNDEFDIYIDNKRVKYSKDYKFDTIGRHHLLIKLYNELDMNYMFKDVKDIVSIEMKSDKNCRISSMISTFENCNNLISFNIYGFDGSKIKSMHKMFYKSGLTSFSSQFNSTINVEDISYMFSFTSIREIKLSNLNFNKVTNMSHMF